MTDPQPTRSRWAILRWAGLLIVMLAGIALFGALVYLSGPARVFAEIVRMGAVGFIVVVASVFGSVFTWSLSWYALLRGAGIAAPWRRTVPPMLAGYAVTYMTPSMYLGGEPVRAHWVAKDQGVSMARVMATALVERILAGFSVVAFASIGALFAVASPRLSLLDRQAIAVGLGTLTVLLAVALVSLTRRGRWLSRLIAWLAQFLPGRAKLVRAAERVAEMEDEIHRAFTGYLGYTALAFFFQLLTVFLSYIRPQLFFYFTQRTLFTFSELSLFFTLSVFVNALLWFTPGGFGITDGGRAGIFTLLGVPLSEAVAFNVVFRFAELLVVGIGMHMLLRRGLLSLRRGRIRVTVDQKPPDG
ncbi:TPA: hypothetical protein DCY65_03860 [Candidatus Acetothermia bacterium]|nr:hypothetical protein [Candidatus Acetothermia bacterium]